MRIRSPSAKSPSIMHVENRQANLSLSQRKRTLACRAGRTAIDDGARRGDRRSPPPRESRIQVDRHLHAADRRCPSAVLPPRRRRFRGRRTWLVALPRRAISVSLIPSSLPCPMPSHGHPPQPTNTVASARKRTRLWNVGRDCFVSAEKTRSLLSQSLFHE